MRRMKKIYQIISILLAVCLLTGVVGCRKKEQKADAKYTIYQINQSGTALVPKGYDGTGKSADEEVKGMLSALQKCDDEVKAQAALPKKVKLERYTLEDEKLILYYNAAYGKMDTVREVLCRAAVVRTMTQISGIDCVSFYVDEKPLTDVNGKMVGTMYAESFVENPGEQINTIQNTNLTLYFSNQAGDGLVKETRRVHYSSNISLEKLIMEQLLEGPESKNGRSAIPSGTKLMSVSLVDGVCYVSFDENFKNQDYSVNEAIVIYSIVDSLSELSSISKVQISVNGDTSGVYRDSFKLADMYDRNLDYIAKTAETDTEVVEETETEEQ